MRLKKTTTDWIDESIGQSVVKSICEILKGKSSDSEAYYAVRPFVCMIMSAAYDMGFEEGSKSNQQETAAPSFLSMVALKIEKIKAAKNIVRTMDGIKEACVQRGRGVKFSEEMVSAYETALKFLEDQLKEDIPVEVNIEVPE